MLQDQNPSCVEALIPTVNIPQAISRRESNTKARGCEEFFNRSRSLSQYSPKAWGFGRKMGLNHTNKSSFFAEQYLKF